jgi:energy-converting hydrogenase B subunit D
MITTFLLCSFAYWTAFSAILTGFSGGALAVLFQILLAPDVALTQAIVGAAIVPVFIALAVQKTQREDS